MSIKFSNFNILHCSGNVRKIFGKICNVQTFCHFHRQPNREFLRYKALNMTFGRGPLLLQKYQILPQRRKKTKLGDFETT